MTHPPRIAIPVATSFDPAYNQRCQGQYTDAIAQSGGVPVVIVLDQEPSAIARLAASCNGILLPGSPADLHPQKYGQAPDPHTAARDTLREAADELLLQDAFNLHKPILGICYGHQSINVWKGGTLVQHLETGLDHEAGPAVERAHTIRLTAASSLLHAAFGDAEEVVNSSHHQAVGSVGDGLRVTAVAPEDGTVEAVEGQAGFVVGVQWHPERAFHTHPASRKLFASFVAAAAAWRAESPHSARSSHPSSSRG